MKYIYFNVRLIYIFEGISMVSFEIPHKLPHPYIESYHLHIILTCVRALRSKNPYTCLKCPQGPCLLQGVAQNKFCNLCEEPAMNSFGGFNPAWTVWQTMKWPIKLYTLGDISVCYPFCAYPFSTSVMSPHFPAEKRTLINEKPDGQTVQKIIIKH